MATLDWKMPYKVLFGKTPTYDHLRVMGCLCFVVNHPTPKDKFEPKGIKHVFLGYTNGKKGYRVFYLNGQRILESRDAWFYEHLFPFHNS